MSKVSLAGVVRPMLLVGLHPEPEDLAASGLDAEDLHEPPFADQRRACAELGRAMTALLPGIDANDHDKTMATIAFYLAVLSNCVRFTGHDFPAEAGSETLELDFCAEDFVFAFLQRFFGAVGDLEVNVGTADGTSGGDSAGCAPLAGDRSAALLPDLWNRCMLAALACSVRSPALLNAVYLPHSAPAEQVETTECSMRRAALDMHVATIRCGPSSPCNAACNP